MRSFGESLSPPPNNKDFYNIKDIQKRSNYIIQRSIDG